MSRPKHLFNWSWKESMRRLWRKIWNFAESRDPYRGGLPLPAAKVRDVLILQSILVIRDWRPASKKLKS